MATTLPTPTEDLWESYRLIFDYLNEALFDTQLPACVLNFATHGRSNGFFTPSRWQQVKSPTFEKSSTKGRGQVTAHELSLNPVLLDGPLADALAWLVRLMVQLKLHEQGSGKNHPQGYYSKEFSCEMWSLGLPCSRDGTQEGKRTGYTMRHWREPLGKFEQAIKGIPEDYFPWIGERRPSETRHNKPIKYGCPNCGTKVITTRPMRGICTTENCHEPFVRIA